MKRLRRAKSVTYAEMEKGFFYGPFTSRPVPASTVQRLLLRSPSLYPRSHFSAPPLHPSCDVLKGHVKYSGGIFITVLSGNARGLISLSARGRRAKWIANVFGCQCARFF